MDGPVVDATWLMAHADEVRIVDVRWYLDGRSGRAAYLAGHIPGAVWLDVDADLADPPGAGRHPLPSPQRFAAAMTRAGIGDDTPVVAYDDAGGSIAARLWWLLHIVGQPVAVLDGGLAAWSGPLEIGEPEPVEPAAAPFTPRPFPAERLASAERLAEVAGVVDAAKEAEVAGETGADRLADAAGVVVVVDARTAGRYAQGDPAIDPRPGHIPGAVSAPWAGNLDATGRFLPPDELRSRYAKLGVEPGRAVVAYCGSGVTACHDLLALTRAGIRDVRLYPGSWSEWGADHDRPSAVGPNPAG
ncbi:MAG: sulfurtransferase [Acidimicrobiales bacterium]